MRLSPHSVIMFLCLFSLSTWSDPITKTFIHGQNGYNEFKSATIGSYYDEVDSTSDIGQKMVLDWWINNAMHETNCQAACISDMIC